jgi:para-nitrobenzyl esterase
MPHRAINLLPLACLVCSLAAHVAPPVLKIAPVHTDKGQVSGVPTADGKVLAFKGIPYAAPPVEDLRWKAPQPAPKWKHVLAANDFGAH